MGKGHALFYFIKGLAEHIIAAVFALHRIAVKNGGIGIIALVEDV